MISYSGIGTYLQNLLPFITKEFKTILLGNKKEIEYYSIRPFKIININSRIYSICEHIELPLKIRRTDIYWSPHYVLPLLNIRSKVIVSTVHDINHVIFTKGIKRLYSKIMISNALRKSEKIITVSNFSKGEMIKYFNVSEKKIVTIYNGIDRKLFQCSKNDQFLQKIKKKYKLPERFILYVGSVKPHKNLYRAVLAFMRLVKDYNDLYFIIIGKSDELITSDKRVLDMIHNDNRIKNRVILQGIIEKNILPYFYKLSDLLLFPSLYEGFGLPPLEAMACGTPVVASKLSSITEVCGDAAYYVDPYSEEDIAYGCHNVLSDNVLKSNLIKKGLQRVMKFDWWKSAEKHMKLFKSLLNE